MAGAECQLASPLAIDFDGQAGIGCLDDDFVVEAQREPDAVEARAEVGAGRRDDEAGQQPGRQQLGHSTSSSFATTATGSTGTADTVGMSRNAVSGSLRPLP